MISAGLEFGKAVFAPPALRVTVAAFNTRALKTVRRVPGRPLKARGRIDRVSPSVKAVSRDELHRFSKRPAEAILLVAGLGVAGDAHAGTLVQHRSRVRRDPNQLNLRQVHLIHAELFDEARALGYQLAPGDLGENILTMGLDLLGLPTNTTLKIGKAVIRLTGLRNPCAQINEFRPGLLKVVLERTDGTPQQEPAPSTGSAEIATVPLVRKAGVMAVVERGGTVRAGQSIRVALPEGPHEPLQPV